MVTYIKISIPEIYVTLEYELDPRLYDDIGESFEDYLDGKWVKLSENQLAFKESNPDASVKEVFDMQMVIDYISEEERLILAKKDMIEKIEDFDNSPSVNSFIINDAISAWFTVQERLNYKQSVEAAKLLGLPALDFYVGDIMLNISPSDAELMLAQIQLYADKCFIVTKQHKLTVQNLTSVNDVLAYDYTVGYPEKLNFNL